MSSQGQPMYDTLDDLIVAAVRMNSNPHYNRYVRMNCSNLGVISGRRVSQLISARLQSLRKRGVIEYRTKNDTGGKAGWYLLQGKGHE